MSEWQPIESAPKDGTPILALWPYWPKQAAFETYWMTAEMCDFADQPCWYAPLWGHILDGCEPSAWMPLTELPA